ncbi:MAG: UDP-N-acetylmuramate dehydrogenase [Candidatus Pacebacteria bacterium]|nr:UDP-N-acetylmuramate dehydrogenase [Candidatus Paceibacterota bacterium]MDD5621032.1 UDP-N-acetylmuramate dehydrogenase [Candidatus Paceibacterota bacterium]
MDNLTGIKRNVSLKNHSTFRIGGIAKYFFEAENKEEILKAIKTAKKSHLPFFILGGGSNILFSDKRFNGLIIKINNQDLEIKKNAIIAGAGIKLSRLVLESAKHNLSGLEWAAGLPGTLGGAIYGNAGAFSKSIKDSVKSIKVFDAKILKIKNLSAKQCKFGYKESIFKKNRNLVIISCELILKKGNLKEEITKTISQRKKTQPLNFPSAGCIFKNYLGKIKNRKIVLKYPELEMFNEKRIIPAGFLIEKCGLKGKNIGGAQISKLHANFIINTNDAKAKDVFKLINLIEKKVKKEFKISMEKEIQIFN